MKELIGNSFYLANAEIISKSAKIVQIRVWKKLEQVFNKNVEQQYTQNRTLQYAC